MAHTFRVSRAGMSLQLLFPFNVAAIPRPGSRMYRRLATALSEYWIDVDQVLVHGPHPRLSDAFVELALPDDGVEMRFSYDELHVSISSVIGTNPESIGRLIDTLEAVLAPETPPKGDPAVSLRYWVHASLSGNWRSILGLLGQGTQSTLRLSVASVTFSLAPDETPHREVRIQAGPSDVENQAGLFLDYEATLDKIPSASLTSVVADAFRLRNDLLERLELRQEGEEGFTSWFAAHAKK